MNEGITVLSLFDGLSGGQIALERAGIKVKKYYASEIDRYAMQITQKHYPDTIQLGDINNWKEWDIDVPDLILAGSPCTGFSNAGLGLGFDDPRSKLFFVFCDILAHYHGKNLSLKYMLENVKMKKEWRDVITDRMKVEPVLINSALVSAQNRERLYWANWTFPQPEDKHIYLKDIVEYGEVDRLKSYTIDANYFKGGNPRSYFEDGKRQLVFEHQSQKRAMVRVASLTERRTEEAKEIRRKYRKERGKYFSPRRAKELVERTDNKANCLTANLSKEHLLVFVGGIGDKDWAKDGKKLSRNYPQGRRVYSVEGKSTSLTSQGVGSVGGYTGVYQFPKKVGMADDIKGKEQWRRSYSAEGKSPTVVSSGGGHHEPKIALDEYYYRKLTPLECERLQTLEDNWTEGVSNTQRYKMLGNGWTIDVVAHILSHMNKEQSL